MPSSTVRTISASAFSPFALLRQVYIENVPFDKSFHDPGSSFWPQEKRFADLLTLLVEEPLGLPML